jgi:hypothetical protein
MSNSVIIAPAYFGNIQHFSILANADDILVDVHEHFVKQSYRTRCSIYGANGKLSLYLPMEKRSERTPLKDVKISYAENWQRLHWKSLETAYRSTPFFEYYEDDIIPFFEGQHYQFVVDLNEAVQQVLCELLELTPTFSNTEFYQKEHPGRIDYRAEIHPKHEDYIHPEYPQIFADRHGYIPNLSVLDLLFNLGSEAASYLRKLSLPISKLSSHGE